jgi:hypothetical protein
VITPAFSTPVLRARNTLVVAHFSFHGEKEIVAYSSPFLFHKVYCIGPQTENPSASKHKSSCF